MFRIFQEPPKNKTNYLRKSREAAGTATRLPATVCRQIWCFKCKHRDGVLQTFPKTFGFGFWHMWHVCFCAIDQEKFYRNIDWEGGDSKMLEKNWKRHYFTDRNEESKPKCILKSGASFTCKLTSQYFLFEKLSQKNISLLNLQPQIMW